jgi:uncharacterized delta-60 repeat protein
MRRWLVAAWVLAQLACHSKGPDSTEEPVTGNLRLSLLPTRVSLSPGDVFPVEVILERPPSFAEPITVTVAGLPDGVAASPLTIPLNTGVFNLSAATGAAMSNNAAVAVTGSGGGLSGSATLSVTVGMATRGFSLSVNPGVLRLFHGVTGSATVNVVRHNFGDPVTVTVSGLPDAGITANPLSISGNSGTLVLRITPSVSPATFPLTVLGTAGSISGSAPLALVVLDPGGVDENFGDSPDHRGYVISHLDSSDGGTTVTALAVAVQPDGKIVVAGNRTRPRDVGGPGCGGGGLQNCVALTLTRYNSDGTFDSTFGQPDSGVLSAPPPGVAILPEVSAVGPRANPQAIAFAADGGILVAAGGLGTAPDTLLGFTSDGVLDPGFNPGPDAGHAERKINAKAVAVIPDGGILVAGMAYPPPTTVVALALARYNTDGRLDRTFGDGGILLNQFVGNPSISTTCGATFTGDKAKVAALTQSRIGIMSFDITGSGSIDESFNGTGQVLVQLGGANNSPCAVLDVNGNTVVVAALARDIVLGSFLADGGLDPSFGDGGVAFANLPADAGTPSPSAAATFVGKIVVAGSLGGNQLLIARYFSDGSPDLTFGTSGTGFIRNVPNLGDAVFNAVTIQDDGKIVGAGNAPSASGQQMVIRYLGSTSE